MNEKQSMQNKDIIWEASNIFSHSTTRLFTLKGTYPNLYSTVVSFFSPSSLLASHVASQIHLRMTPNVFVISGDSRPSYLKA